MDNSAISSRYALALELIREAGDLAHDYFRRRGSLTVRSKGVQDMASEADLNTELMIRDRLAKVFPDDGFLGEETGRTDVASGRGLWVVDPIDGTQPFVSGLTGWCVSIAFVLDNALIFGMVYAPARNELFAGGRDFPATLNGSPVERHPGKAITDGIVGVGYSPRVTPDEYLPIFGRLLRAGGMFYREGSGALTLCYVACGRLIGYIEAHINAWDCLGALAVIHAAGLKSNDFFADDGLHVGNRLVAGNDEVYAALERVYGLHAQDP
jgi:myo-inositol-1(or 4)-monophosphatase